MTTKEPQFKVGDIIVTQYLTCECNRAVVIGVHWDANIDEYKYDLVPLKNIDYDLPEKYLYKPESVKNILF
jgi:hypothetical protein